MAIDFGSKGAPSLDQPTPIPNRIRSPPSYPPRGTFSPTDAEIRYPRTIPGESAALSGARGPPTHRTVAASSDVDAAVQLQPSSDRGLAFHARLRKRRRARVPARGPARHAAVDAFTRVPVQLPRRVPDPPAAGRVSRVRLRSRGRADSWAVCGVDGGSSDAARLRRPAADSAPTANPAPDDNRLGNKDVR